jgi:hypothetical protein
VSHRKFIFDSYRFNSADGSLSLRYSYDDELFFSEIIKFPVIGTLDSGATEALDRIFKYLHIAAGVSYYKLFVPEEIELRSAKLDREQAEFFNVFYRNGLGEFSFRNNIVDLRERIRFPSGSESESFSRNSPILRGRTAIALGGGKDSVVTLEIVRKHMNNLLLCSVGRAKSIDDIARISGLEYLAIERVISPLLLDLNGKLRELGGYNGHVPISGIIAFILLAAGVIYGFDRVLLSNERSANVGNVDFGGSKVNHQWSKSFEFEKSFNSFVEKYIFSGFSYLSFLRPLSEIHIVKLFAAMEQYHGVFASCNGNFRLGGQTKRWCCHCPKCRFVFLMLAVYLSKKDLVSIFGENLLADEDQLEGFRELCGIKNHKPFDCVGEIEESVYAILHVSSHFRDDFIVRRLEEELGPVDSVLPGKKLFTPSPEHLLTRELQDVLNSALC